MPLNLFRFYVHSVLLPLGDNPRLSVFWEPVVSKVAKRLDGWKKDISKGGRLTLIQSVLASLTVYYLSLFRIPTGVAEAIEKLMRDFLWKDFNEEKATHLVAWERVCKPKKNGGLGIGNLMKRNEALLCKWLWRFPKDALWHKVIKGKCGLSDNGWDSGLILRVILRCPWKAVQAHAAGFFQHLKWKLGWCDSMRFWENTWCGETSISVSFPALHRLCTLHNQPIHSFLMEPFQSNSLRI